MDKRVEAIVNRIIAPSFPEKEFIITDYGAVGDGKTDATQAIAQAIEEAHRHGGGRVVVPEGRFSTGAIRIKSQVELHVREGGTLLFHQNPGAYLPMVRTSWEGVECFNYSPLIYAYGEENIAITGAGTLDGQADETHWWPWKRGSRGQPCQEEDRQVLFQMAESGVPVEERRFGKGHYLRPYMIQPYRCKNILIEGVTIQDSPMWHVNPTLCENVTIRNVKIVGHGPNNDGVNPESCRDVLIEDCFFDNGDDCIAIKSFRNADGRRIHVPSENIVIRRNRMKDGHGGVVIGSEVSGGVRNVFAYGNVFDSPNLDRVLRLKTNSVRGGVLEKIYLYDNVVKNVRDQVIHIDMHYEEGDAGKYPPAIRDIEVRGLQSTGGRIGLEVDAYPHSPVCGLRISDASFEDVEETIRVRHVKDLQLENVFFNGKRMDLNHCRQS